MCIVRKEKKLKNKIKKINLCVDCHEKINIDIEIKNEKKIFLIFFFILNFIFYKREKKLCGLL